MCLRELRRWDRWNVLRSQQQQLQISATRQRASITLIITSHNACTFVSWLGWGECWFGSRARGVGSQREHQPLNTEHCYLFSVENYFSCHIQMREFILWFYSVPFMFNFKYIYTMERNFNMMCDRECQNITTYREGYSKQNQFNTSRNSIRNKIIHKMSREF